MKKLEQYVIYIGLTVSILFNVVCGLSIMSLNNDIVQLEDYVDVQLGYKSISSKLDEAALDTAYVDESVN